MDFLNDFVKIRQVIFVFDPIFYSTREYLNAANKLLRQFLSNSNFALRE